MWETAMRLSCDSDFARALCRKKKAAAGRREQLTRKASLTYNSQLQHRAALPTEPKRAHYRLTRCAACFLPHMPPRKKACTLDPTPSEARLDAKFSFAKNAIADVPRQDFEKLTISELRAALIAANISCDRFKKKADYIAALLALPVPPPPSSRPAITSANQVAILPSSIIPAATPFSTRHYSAVKEATARERDPRFLQQTDDADFAVQAYGNDSAPQAAVLSADASLLEEFFDGDGSDDDDGPQCLADILPAPQRAKLNPASHKAAMFIMTADVQLLFSSMARDTLRKGTVGRKAKGHLDAEAQRIMGQANLEFAMGNFDRSKELCLRVVQLQPHSTQPYSTLSSIYESAGDTRRATDYLLCAAVVKPRDADIWAQLATKFQELGQLKSALHCLKRASSNRRGDLNLLWARFELQSQLHVDGQYRLSLDTLEMILRRGVASSPSLPLDPLVKTAAMRLAFEHHKNRKVENAASILRVYLQATEARGTADYDACNLFAECMAMLQQWGEMSSFLNNLQNQSRSRLPPELLLHLALGEVHLGRSSSAYQIMAEVLPSIAPKLYVSVVTALRVKGRCDLALQLISSFDSSFKVPFVLLEAAKCFIDSNLHSRAVPLLQQLRSQYIDDDDDSMEGSLLLVDCLRVLNRNDEAEAINRTLPVAQASLPKGLQHCLRRADVLKKTNVSAFADQLVVIFQSLGGSETQSSVEPADAWMLMVQTVQALLWSSRAADAVKVMNIARSSVNALFDSKVKDGSFHILLLRCAIEAKDHTTCDTCLRCILQELVRPDNMRCLTCIPDLARSCIAIMSSSQISHFYRALVRKFFSSGTEYVLTAPFLCMLDCFKNKDSSMHQHVPIISIGLHAAALMDDPKDPLPPLLLVSSYLTVTISRRTVHRHKSFLSALSFLQRYADCRGDGHWAEICFNYGRFFHGLSLLSFAIPCYERAIELSLQLAHDQMVHSVVNEAAFNLSLIYRQSGQHDLERFYLLKYLVI